MRRSNTIAASLTLAAMVVGATPGMAADQIPHPVSPPEKGQRLADGAGVGGGMLIGGLVGGPIGMMVGAGLGTWLGGRVVEAGRSEEAKAALAQTERTLEATVRELNHSVATQEALALDLADRDRSFEQLQGLAAEAQEANQALRSALASGIEMQVMFRTGESELTAESAAQVTRLASVLTGVDGVSVQLDGYADPRGDEQYNEALTAARVASVEQALRAGGLQEQQLAGFAHGERAYAFEAGDYDAYALERRVDISLQAVEGPSFSTADAPAVGDPGLALLGER